MRFSFLLLFALTVISSTVLFSYQDIQGEEFVFEKDMESDGCNTIAGTWIETDRICYIKDITIGEDDSLIMNDSGYLVVFTGTIENNGNIFINYVDGTVLFAGVFNNNDGALLENHGIPSNDVGIPKHPDFEIDVGMINNHGTIDNYGGFVMSGLHQRISSDTPDDFIAIENHGTLNNSGFLAFNTGSIVNNYDTINNEAEMIIGGTLNNDENATLNNALTGSMILDGVLDNQGTVINSGNFENRFCEGQIINSGTVQGNELPIEVCSDDANDMMSESNDSNSTKENDSANGGGCLIATAAYGSELAPQVQFLREIRDNTVMSTESGASFMTGFNQLYYVFSPTIADMQRENPMFQQVVRAFITPMISTLSIMTLAEDGNDVEVFGLGFSVIVLNLGMYFGIPFATIITTKKYL